MKKKKKHQEISEEELFGFYKIIDYTSGGAPIGITLEEAEEEGWLEEDEVRDTEADELPF